jgi:hypothetical protein
MTDHLEKHFPMYLVSGLCLVLVLLLSAVALEEKARKRAEAYCQDRGMLVVQTPAGERCAPLWALERPIR